MHTSVDIFSVAFVSSFLYLISVRTYRRSIDTKGVDVLCYNIFTSVAYYKGVPARNYARKKWLHNRFGNRSINLDTFRPNISQHPR